MAIIVRLGRLLQLSALAILPLGVILEVSGRLGRRGVAELLLIMVFGLPLFRLDDIWKGMHGPRWKNARRHQWSLGVLLLRTIRGTES